MCCSDATIRVELAIFAASRPDVLASEFQVWTISGRNRRMSCHSFLKARGSSRPRQPTETVSIPRCRKSFLGCFVASERGNLNFEFVLRQTGGDKFQLLRRAAGFQR